MVTTRATLQQATQSEVLSQLLKGIPPDESSPSVFVDRDYNHVLPLINYLRTKHLCISLNTSRQGVLQEARYFQIPEVIKELEASCGGMGAEITREQMLDVLLANPSGTPVRLRGLNLSYLQLSRLDLSHAILDLANMTGVTLRDADMTKVSAARVQLSNASLCRANLSGATC